MPERVLIADDEVNYRKILRRELGAAGFVVAEVGRGDEALERLRAEPFDVVLLDLKMPGVDGLSVLREARRAGCGAEVIVLTGHGTIDSVVEAMKLGAFDYLTKPARLAELELLVRRAVAHRRSAASDPSPAPGGSGEEASEGGDDGMLATSPALQHVIQVIDKAAPTDAPVLIEGESGTGKELLSRRLHRRSKVASGPFVAIHCGAIQDSLVLSELFGHEKGAFTGADRAKLGLLEQASGGTAFLDETGELSMEAQVRLLRFLQFGEFRRVGGNELLTAKVRIVAATNRRLLEEAQAGRFREDLYYRLNTIHVRIPPLRERPEEIPMLARCFLARSAAGRGRSFHPDALALLVGYPWPGNVRELENIVLRLAILCDAEEITKEDVLRYFEGLSLLGAGGRRRRGRRAARGIGSHAPRHGAERDRGGARAQRGRQGEDGGRARDRAEDALQQDQGVRDQAVARGDGLHAGRPARPHGAAVSG